MPIHHEDTPFFFAAASMRRHSSQRCRQRFFDEDVHTTPGSFDHDIGVGIVGSGDGDRIQPFVQQVIQLGERLGYPKLPAVLWARALSVSHTPTRSTEECCR